MSQHVMSTNPLDDIDTVSTEVRRGSAGEGNERPWNGNGNGRTAVNVREFVDVIQRIAQGDLGARLSGTYTGDYALLRDATNMLRDNFSGVIQSIGKIAAGDLSVDIVRQGANDQIQPQLLLLKNNIGSLVTEANLLAKAAVDGKLDTRADASRHQGDYRKIVEGVNHTLDAVIGPLNVAAEYVDRISKGDTPERITDKYNGDFNDIKNNLNRCIDTLNSLALETNNMSKQHDLGDIDIKIPVEKFTGMYHSLVQGVNEMVFGHIAVKKKAMACIAEFARGNYEAPLERFPGKKSFINDNIELLRTNLNSFIKEMSRMADEHNKGDIDVVIPGDKFTGAYHVMAKGVNDMVAGHISVKKKAMACIAEFAKGNLEAVLEKFPGKKAFINENIELLRTHFKNFIEEMHHMSEEHNKGDIDVTIPADKFAGSYRTMAQGVNDMVAGHITVKKKAMACIAEFSRGNFEAVLEKFPGKKAFINENIELLRSNLKALVVDADLLAKAAVEGKLATRADAARHQGDYRKIVEGVNHTLDAVIGPLNVSADYVDKISKGTIPQKITDSYNGDFNIIKNNLNLCIDNINAVAGEIQVVSNAVKNGNVAARGDTNKVMGVYSDIVNVANSLMQHVENLVNEMDKQVQALDVSSVEIGEVSQKMAANAEETSAQANVVSAAAEQVTRNIQTVATGTEEMSSSVKEIAKNANDAARVAMNAVKSAEETSKTVGKLDESSTEIGKVIKVITSIAQQTNLLALNATIEAARAGEAGKGFAVVANEVKELARQTANATEDIGQKIEAIQTDTRGAIDAIGQISAVINQINSIQMTIASSVEEQTATTNEIARNSAEAAKGGTEISKNIEAVSVAAKETTGAAARSQRSAQDLTRISGDLKKLVAQFKK